jgi:predicted methyltransferase
MNKWIVVVALLFGCASTKQAPPPPTAVPTTEERTEADKALDAGRKPDELITFIGVKSGMRVADLMAGGGYTTELLARAVGPEGVVYGQNNKFVLERFAEKPWSERLARTVNKNVVRVDRELESPLPPEVNGALDVVTMILFYHDSVWMKADRDAMNKAIFDALKPGGVYVIVDHSAIEGHGVADVQTLHRIDEAVVKEEVSRAGFVLAEEGSFLRNPGDARDWNDSPGAAKERRGTSDRFVLKFKKP